MRQRRLLWQLYPSYIFITIISLIAVTWYASQSFRQFFLEQTAADLEASAQLIEKHFPKLISAMDIEHIDSLCKDLGGKSSTRVTVVNLDGIVLGDTDENPEDMNNHADRPEFIAAMDSSMGMSVRYSYTLEQNMMYVAIPVRNAGFINGAVRLSIPINTIDTALRATFLNIVLVGLIVVVAAAGMGFYISRRISRPLEEIKSGAERFAEEKLDHKLPIFKTLEISSLSIAMNKMASQLDTRIKTIVSQRNERQAVLESMVEGVLAVDNEERVLSLNTAASKLLKIDPEQAKGRTLHEIVRNIDLQRFVARVLSNMEPAEEQIILRENGELHLQLHGTVLRDADGNRIGVLTVLNDVTRLHRLEAVRRDFVANVSHELKTPVTSIKGFVETLLDGAINDPESAQKFLGVIARQADRLNLIIEDLLTLSRIEQDSERAQISFESQNLKPVIKTAIEVCELKAHERKIKTKLECPDDLTARINAPLLEQAVINLIDNAIKFSESDESIEIQVIKQDGNIIINVLDRGCGIAREHLSRLFERFYLVDKARSRKLGGTGLGLAIVKHICQLHGGYPTVASVPGQGSTFSIHLPESGDK